VKRDEKENKEADSKISIFQRMKQYCEIINPN